MSTLLAQVEFFGFPIDQIRNMKSRWLFAFLALHIEPLLGAGRLPCLNTNKQPLEAATLEAMRQNVPPPFPLYHPPPFPLYHK